MKNNKIMILGAGNFQLEGIKSAIKLGYNVITLDNIITNPGHKHSHISINCDYTDLEKIYKNVLKYKPTRICTFASDLALLSVFLIEKKYKISKSFNFDVKKLIFKDKFRKFQNAERLNSPKFLLLNKSFNSKSLIKFNKINKLICKPYLSSGSKGIKLFDNKKTDSYETIIEYTKNSYYKNFIIEEYLEGTEYGGDVIIKNGNIEFIAITKKYKEGINIIGHRILIKVPNNVKKTLSEELLLTCKKLNFKNGILNFDIILTNNKAIIIEMSPRTGGNGISQLIKLSTNIDIEKYYLQKLFNKEVPLKVNKSKSSYASLLIGDKKGGQISNLSSASYLKKSIPEIHEVVFFKKQKDFVKKFTNSSGIICMLIFKCKNDKDFYIMKKKIINSLSLKIMN